MSLKNCNRQVDKNILKQSGVANMRQVTYCAKNMSFMVVII